MYISMHTKQHVGIVEIIEIVGIIGIVGIVKKHKSLS